MDQSKNFDTDMNIPKELIEKYNVAVPRYTSYPPANFFKSGLTEETYLRMIDDSNADKPSQISIYIHIPMCKKICHFCGCFTYRMTGENITADYIEALKKEILHVSKHLDKSRKVSQIHYGGGTPNAIDAHYLQSINDLLFREFQFTDQPEIAIECNPAYLDHEYVDALLHAKFNRFSLGIQDFDLEVLKSVNREPSLMPLEELVAYLRHKKPDVSINLDFVYGLPGQTLESFADSISRAIAIRPERLVTFSYAHVPWMKKHQKILERKGLPDSNAKSLMFQTSRQLLLDAGYQAIGLDHYVLPGDELEVALRMKKLHRNFQGYCTRQTTGQVYAFGVSSISQLENGYIQNIKDTKQYIADIQVGKLPYEKGYQLSENQKIVRDIITEIMCNYQVDLSLIAQKYQKPLEELYDMLQFSEKRFAHFMQDGLLQLDGAELQVTEKGTFFVRNIAVAFDPMFLEQTELYSKSI